MKRTWLPIIASFTILLLFRLLSGAPAAAFAKTGPKEIEQRLKKTLEQISEKADASETPESLSARSDPSGRQAPRSLPAQEVRIRPKTQTPMQIRVTSPSRGTRMTAQSEEEIARDFLRSHRALLNLIDPDEELLLESKLQDNIGYTHLRYAQRYFNIPVWPAELIVHLDPTGNPYLLNGAFVPTPKKAALHPELTAEDAEARAREHVSGGDGAAVVAPELIFYADMERRPQLAWKTELTLSLTEKWVVVVDAVSGAILTAYNRVPDASASGSGVDLLGVRRNIELWQAEGEYYMVNTAKPMYDPAASAPPNPDETRGGIIILDAENQPPTSDVQYLSHITHVTSGSTNENWLPDAVSAARNISESYDYFLERHNRDSIDGQGGSIIAIVRVGQNFANAAWADMMIFGDAQPFAAALDVVAHELAHGVTTATANLIYQNQSGALNEAFSDIFGEMTEARTNGSTDWVLGTRLPEQIRSLSDPASQDTGIGRPYPSRMSEYINTYQDYGGVHLNATIITHAFYLLAQGMDGAIGMRDAERIFYRALAYHLVSSSRFIDARLACIVSAEELFGQGSAQAIRTAAAFDAVEITDAEPTPNPDETEYIPPPSGPDAILFVYYDEGQGDHYLGRRQSGDPAAGVRLSHFPVSPARASVREDGGFAAFVNKFNDMCLILTDGAGTEECLGYEGLVSSVAMSPDGRFYGFVFLDETGMPGDSITVIDTDSDNDVTYELVAPAFDGVSTNTIIRADAMTFTSDNRYIVYDALNRIELLDGAKYDAWSIYAIDLTNGQTLVLMPPTGKLDIGFPALSQTNDNFITYDAFDPNITGSTIYAQNMIKNTTHTITEVSGDWGTPFYMADDSGIIYSQRNPTIPTGFNIWLQPLAGDRITPAGEPSLYLTNADFGVVYRREALPDEPDVPDNGDDDVVVPDDGNGGGGGGGCFIGAAGF